MDETIKKIDDLVNHYGLYLQTFNDSLKPLIEELEKKLPNLNEADLVHIQKWPGRLHQSELSAYTYLYCIRREAIKQWGLLLNGKQQPANSKQTDMEKAISLLKGMSKEELAKAISAVKKL